MDDDEYLKSPEEIEKEELEAMGEELHEFKTKFLEVVFKYFYDNNYPFEFKYKDFKEKCTEELDLLLEEIHFRICWMYNHYLESSENFLKNDELPIFRPNRELGPDFTREYFLNVNPACPVEFIDSRIREAKRDNENYFQYHIKFHNTIKKFVLDYFIEDDSHFTGRTFRELDYLTNCYYLELEDRMQTIAYEMEKEIENPAIHFNYQI